jgi:hypothetical protein
MSILADGWSLVNSAGEVISEALGLGDGDDSGGAMGSLRYILVEGDPLVGETGIILPVGRSSPALTGIPVAFIGDMVQCYTCGQIKPIEKDGGPYRVGIFSGDVDISVFDIVNATEEFAYENDVIYCACGKKPLQAVLAPVQKAKDTEDAPTVAMLSGLKRELGEGWELVKAEVGSWRYENISSGIHIGLGAAGAIPVLGVVPDVVDAVYTSGEAIFSEHSSGADAAMAWGAVGASIIPGVDQAADAAKIAKRTADAADLVHDAGVAADAAHDLEKMGSYRPDRTLPRDKNGNPIPDSDLPHSQIGSKEGRKGEYTQAREWGYDDKGNLVPKKDIDFTDHGRPGDHPNPHQHRWIDNETGGTPKHGSAKLLELS